MTYFIMTHSDLHNSFWKIAEWNERWCGHGESGKEVVCPFYTNVFIF